MSDYLLSITCGGLSFGLDVHNDVIVNAAPVAAWMRGKSVAWAIEYWRRRGAQVQWMRWPDGDWMAL